MLSASDLLNAIEVAARDVMQGRIRLPPRLIQPLGGGVDLFAMLATSDDLGIVKLLSIGAARTEKALAKLLVVQPNGVCIGEFDAAATTAARTAAVTFACVRRLRHPLGKRVLVVGAGRQARAHVDMLMQLAPEATLLVAGRNGSSINDLVRYACDHGLDASAASSLESAAADADLIITATSSRTPVIPDCARDDAIVVAVGNYRPDATELPQSLVARSRCYADSLQGAKHEAGEYLLAGVDWTAVQALDTHDEWQRDRSRPAIVKSVGSAAWDLAWARALLQRRTNSQ